MAEIAMAAEGQYQCDSLAIYGNDNIVTETRFRNNGPTMGHVRAYRFDHMNNPPAERVVVYEFDAPTDQWVIQNPPPAPMAVEWVEPEGEDPYPNTVYFTDGTGTGSDKEVTLVCRPAS